MATTSNATPACERGELDKSKQQVRLLQFWRSDNGIHCDVSIHDLANQPSYKALSYCWGEGSPHTVLIDERPYAVSSNLFRFLEKYTTTRNVEQYYWIDQISINQSSVEERNHQVRLMSLIYERAETVTIWLGDTTEHYESALIVKMSSFESCCTVKELLSDSYFERLWIVQECLLARNIEVMTAGTGHIDWYELQGLFFIEEDLRHDAQGPTALFTGRSSVQLWSLVDCIAKFSNQKCAEVRDKVYGLMGLVNSEETLAIDYQKSVEEIFADVLTVRLRSSQTIKESHVRNFVFKCDLRNVVRVMEQSCRVPADVANGLLSMGESLLDDPGWHSHSESTYPYNPGAIKIGYSCGVPSTGLSSENMDIAKPGIWYATQSKDVRIIETELVADRWWYERCGRRHFPKIPKYVWKGKTYKVAMLEVDADADGR